MKEDLVAGILGSGKYRGLHEDLVRRVVDASLSSASGRKEADKRARKELHRVYGSFQTTKPRYSRWLREIEQAEDPLEALRPILRTHSSTKEREPFLEPFYAAVFEAVGPCEYVLDIGCGLNPLTMAWAPPGLSWWGCDVDAEQMAFVRDVARLLGHPVLTETVDLLSAPTLPSGDVAFLFKVVPCLDPVSWEPGADLIDALQVDQVVVSLPGATLGGRKRGMGEANANRFEHLAERRGWTMSRIDAGVDEVVWVIRERAARR